MINIITALKFTIMFLGLLIYEAINTPDIITLKDIHEIILIFSTIICYGILLILIKHKED